MTTAVPAVRPRALALGRVAAAVAAGSAVTHLLQLSAGGFGALVMATMALACLPCAWHLWRGPTRTAWTVTAAVDAGMLLLHPTLMAQHAHSGAGELMRLGIALVAVQLVMAAAALLRP